MVDPLKLLKKASQILMSSLTLLEMGTWKKRFFKPFVARSKRLEIILVTGITLAVNAKSPRRDWTSFSNPLHLVKKEDIMYLMHINISGEA